MEFHKPILLIFCLSLAAWCRGDPVNLENPPEMWEPILAEMAKPGPLKSQFKESRSNPFHRLPKRFEGRMWWDPEIGLCLFYEEPGQLIVNVLPAGVRMGRPEEPMEALPGSDQEEVMMLFSKLFNWDVEWLNGNFAIEGDISKTDGWQLRLRPVESTLSNRLSRIALEGEGGLLSSIVLHLRGGRTVDIQLSGQERVCALTESELRLAFPDHDG